MSSLWTPDGERIVPPRSDEPTNDGPATGDALRAAAAQLGVDLDSLSPDEVAELRDELAAMMKARAEMAETPAHDMLANHLMRLFDLAVIYLEAEPPRFSDAATVIESFRAVVDNVGERLGPHRSLLQEALSQVQMVFVQVKRAADAAEQEATS